MDRNVNLIAFGTFGSPSGFRQTFFIGGKTLWNTIRTFDLKTDAIKLFPNTKIYSIRKEYAGGSNILSYSIYTFAKERTSERGGTFIGSSILFKGKIAPEVLSIDILNEFHDVLIKRNVENDVIKVDHSDKLSINQPKDFDRLEYQLNEIPDLYDYNSTNKNLVVYCSTKPEILKIFFEKSTDLLNIYDTIYFTDSQEVLQFVHQRGIFQFVEADGFELEIQKLHSDRQKVIESYIEELQVEILKLSAERDNVIDTLKRQIEANEELLAENKKNIDESKTNLVEIDSHYSIFSSQISDYVNQLNSNEKIRTIKELYSENRRIFLRTIEELKKPIQFRRLSQFQETSNFPISKQRNTSSDHRYLVDNSSTRNESKNSNGYLFRVLALFFALLWILTLSYFLWFKNDEIPDLSQKGLTSKEQIDYKVANIPATTELYPALNSLLNEKELNLVAEKIKAGMEVKEVISIIFKNNPGDIEKHYSSQVDNYTKKIIELNGQCFIEKDNTALLTCDTLKYIPSYKK